MKLSKSLPFLVITTIFSLIINTFAIAAPNNTAKTPVFNIISKIYIDGKLITTPHVIARANQQATINLANEENASTLRVKLTASDAPKNSGANEAILINFDVQYKNAKENLNVKPQLIVLPKQKDTVTLTTKSGHTFKIWLVAKREMS